MFESESATKNKMASSATAASRPENMLPIMAVLGIMFIGICIAMNLFSRARFKKRANAFAAASRASNQQRRMTNRDISVPGGSHRLSYCAPSPLPPHGQQHKGDLKNSFNQPPRSPQPRAASKSSHLSHSGRTSIIADA